jgi:glutamate-ammonia-ligase adenylyltransferase
LTQWGRTYSVDTELRPSGRAGILVSSWASFEDYHRKHARIWEKQALLKARPIEPEIAVRDSVSQRLEAQIWNRDYGVKAAKEIHKIRLRMETELAKEDARYYNIKVGSGGIVDIEFAVQYLQLRHGGRVLAVRSPHTLTALRCLASENLLNEAIADELETSYIFYRKVETCLRHRAQRSVGAMPRQHGEELAMLAKSLEKKSELLLQEFEERRRKVREYYLEILGL